MKSKRKTKSIILHEMSQLNLFHNHFTCMTNRSAKSYREKFGLSLPPEGTEVSVQFMHGVDWYILWNNCPDGENILYGWEKKKQIMIDTAKRHGWIII